MRLVDVNSRHRAGRPHPLGEQLDRPCRATAEVERPGAWRHVDMAEQRQRMSRQVVGLAPETLLFGRVGPQGINRGRGQLGVSRRVVTQGCRHQISFPYQPAALFRVTPAQLSTVATQAGPIRFAQLSKRLCNRSRRDGWRSRVACGAGCVQALCRLLHPEMGRRPGRRRWYRSGSCLPRTWFSESSKLGAPGWTRSGKPVPLASFLRILASLPLVGRQRSDAR